ncbi:hypothetical protein C2845_PM14G10810 [Panicum miliaceum]|uniref:DC1 domain-containing protein n=1 Tax=Panicum miliaceum TaxID=4540 RepID=A0A3L6PR29_PANMI|nr:hypothetical protein C2845_PM14G10810 [Panicum miliaceum]
MKQYEDPPAEIFHRAHPAHGLKLAAAGGTLVCDGCKEPGDGARYACGCGGSVSFDLHPPCALADEDEALRHALFPGCDFFFVPASPPPVDRTTCDACGELARGYVYHCFEADLDLHPCCACLPGRVLQDGSVFELRRKASIVTSGEARSSRPCGLCGGRRRGFWAYRSCFDGEAVDLHVTCMKDLARLSWEAAACSKNWGGGGHRIVQARLPNMDRTLQSFPRDKRKRSGFDRFTRIVRAISTD